MKPRKILTMEVIVLRDVKKANNATSENDSVSSGCRREFRKDLQLFHSRWAIVAHSRAQLNIKHMEL
jgi:hypothetical protein